MAMMPKRRQSKLQIDSFYSKDDPWGYFTNEHDYRRREIIVSELRKYNLIRALDIGCGNGFVSEGIPAKNVVAVDISDAAIEEARRRSGSASIDYRRASLFELPSLDLGSFDCILITGVIYEQYIGKSLPLIYQLVDELLAPGGVLACVHIDEWSLARFPYALIKTTRYKYRQYTHLLEVYRK